MATNNGTKLEKAVYLNETLQELRSSDGYSLVDIVGSGPSDESTTYNEKIETEEGNKKAIRTVETSVPIPNYMKYLEVFGRFVTGKDDVHNIYSVTQELPDPIKKVVVQNNYRIETKEELDSVRRLGVKALDLTVALNIAYDSELSRIENPKDKYTPANMLSRMLKLIRYLKQEEKEIYLTSLTHIAEHDKKRTITYSPKDKDGENIVKETFVFLEVYNNVINRIMTEYIHMSGGKEAGISNCIKEGLNKAIAKTRKIIFRQDHEELEIDETSFEHIMDMRVVTEDVILGLFDKYEKYMKVDEKRRRADQINYPDPIRYFREKGGYAAITRLQYSGDPEVPATTKIEFHINSKWQTEIKKIPYPTGAIPVRDRDAMVHLADLIMSDIVSHDKNKANGQDYILTNRCKKMLLQKHG